MNTTNLQKILDSASAILAELRDLESQLAAIRADKDTVIAEASGPDDNAALQKLNVLASQESIAHSKLELMKRKAAGLDPSALNEAICVRNSLLEEVIATRDSVTAKLIKALTPLYDSPEDAAAAVGALNGRNQPPILNRISKALTALHGAGPHRGQTSLEFARVVLSAAERAAAIDN